MKADEFVAVVRRCVPTREELLSYGLSDDEIRDIRDGFDCSPREGAVERNGGCSSELEELLARYDCSSLEVLIITFAQAPEQHVAGVVVGYWEADPIVVLHDGKVVAFDHAEPSHMSAHCAVDSEHFLDALAFLVELTALKEAWAGRADEATRRCVAKSGTGNSVVFYSSLCSFLSR